MRRRLLSLICCSLICAAAPSYAIVGAGFHWGFDLSLKMPDSYNNYLNINSFTPSPLLTSLNLSSTLGISQTELNTRLQGSPVLSGDLPITISRAGFESHVINFGGKVFVDIIPVIDAIEISCNFGLWQYEGAIHYPKGLKTGLNPADFTTPADFTYDRLLDMSGVKELTLKEYGLSYFGLTQTPYAKLHFDATVRKNIVAIPKKMKILRIYAGGGPSIHLQTPVLTPKLVEDMVGQTIQDSLANVTNIQNAMSDPGVMKKIVQKIISGFASPKFGMHIVVGTMVKIPVIPVGFYVDAKYAIPFGDLDKEAKLTGFGLLFNGGITFAL
jgi:hypothetical protein